MSLDWYHLFMLGVLLLWIGAVPSDRSALRIVMAASVASWLLVEFLTFRVPGAWKLVIPAALETLTITALLRWSSGPTAYKQVVLVGVAWLAHVTCFLDLRLGTDFVYSHYEDVLAFVAGAQLVCFNDTYLHHFRRAWNWCSDIGSNRVGGVRASGSSACVSPMPSDPDVQNLPPCTTIYNET